MSARLRDAVAALDAHRAAVVCRKDMMPSEAVALGAELEAIEKPKAKARMVDAHASPGNLPEQKASVRDVVAPAVGMSPRTYEKAKAVVAAARRV